MASTRINNNHKTIYKTNKTINKIKYNSKRCDEDDTNISKTNYGDRYFEPLV